MAAKKSKKKNQKKVDKAAKAVNDAAAILRNHPLFGGLMTHADIVRDKDNLCPPEGWMVVTDSGTLHVHQRYASVDEWIFVLAHGLLHLGFGHFEERAHPHLWNLACDAFVDRFLGDLKLGRRPSEISAAPNFSANNELDLYDRLANGGDPSEFRCCGTAANRLDLLSRRPDRWSWRTTDWADLFAEGLQRAVASALDDAAEGQGNSASKRASPRALAARSWFMSSYPLLGALAASFEIIEDSAVCDRLDIQVAAIDDEAKEIYLNPRAGLKGSQLRFVMAHELMHAGLRHSTRRQGREPYLWNVACDYVINGWLMEMEIGEPPLLGLLHDPALTGLSAEVIYDQIVRDLRRFRKLATFRGQGLGDLLGNRSEDWWSSAEGTDLDAFYRECLSRGLLQHQQQDRGFLPAGLIEGIRALSQPPIPWDVELARWFDAQIPAAERRRSYARQSRRQASTPGIPRPRWVAVEDQEARVFAVVLDTSLSMDRSLLANALGAIASYSLAREVKAIRLLFCDAAVYDQGYLSPETIAGRVQVKGRGGTVLQPALDLLNQASDFPKHGPVLIITDGECDHLRVGREHAYLIPAAASLPFVAKGPVFRIR